ncbi:cell wall hydrolase [Sphingomonas oligophenolica]|uniref:Cell wall hydrolase n=1 Tax=Sphingomonas oligophenolica TaxID=301154 RepID=A0A502CPM6_9SPHN|nr:cell wall hydrolase [Sphingomonas oligophenolica]TPG15595.1 cell wall hydrolase [Sphingomonas oligophenolica]
MTILQRAATLAVMTLTLAGTLVHSTAGHANDIDRTAIPSPNTVTPAMVPANDRPTSVDTALTFIQKVPDEPIAAAPAQQADGDYDSLADAVAAQDVADIDDGQKCLAGAIYFEARGESLSGQLAVANVILNRSKSGRFPSDMCGVVKQRGQFSFVRGGEIPTVRNLAAYRTAIAVAKVAIAAAWDSPAAKALYFNTSGRRPGGRLTRIAMIGNHVFYR